MECVLTGKEYRDGRSDEPEDHTVKKITVGGEEGALRLRITI